LQAIADGSRDPYEGYREVSGIYLDSSGAVEELKLLFRLPDIYPDGPIDVDDSFVGPSSPPQSIGSKTTRVCRLPVQFEGLPAP
jgi:hypothetical protein